MNLNSALSGLQAASTELSVIGNNVANVATTGFKKSRVEFAGVYGTQMLGFVDHSLGTGVEIADVNQIFSQGRNGLTDNVFDLAIAGEGFFVTSNNAENPDLSYTRAGAFRLNDEGFVTNSFGGYLQGYQVTNNAISDQVGNLQVSADTLAPQASSQIDLSLNLNSLDLPPTTAFQRGFSTTSPPSPSSYNSSTSTTIYDALGQPHTMTFYFVKMHAPNSWHTYVGIDGQDVTPAEAAIDPTMNDGDSFNAGTIPKPFTLVFDSNGQMVANNPAAPPVYHGSSYFHSAFSQSNIFADSNSLSVFDVDDFSINGVFIPPPLQGDDPFSTTDAQASTKAIVEAINRLSQEHGATAFAEHAELSMGDITAFNHVGAISNLGTVTVTDTLVLTGSDLQIEVTTQGSEPASYSIVGQVTDLASLVDAINASADLSTHITASSDSNNNLLLQTNSANTAVKLKTDDSVTGNVTFSNHPNFTLGSNSTVDLFDSVTLSDTEKNLVINGVALSGTLNRATLRDDLIGLINSYSNQTHVEAFEDIDGTGNVNVVLRGTIDSEKGRNIQLETSPLTNDQGFTVNFGSLTGTSLFSLDNTNSFNKVIRSNYTLSMQQTPSEIAASVAKLDLGAVTTTTVDTTDRDLFKFVDLGTTTADGTPVEITLQASGTAETITLEEMAALINDQLYINYAQHTDPQGQPYFSSPVAHALIKRVSGQDRLIIESQDIGREFRLDSSVASGTTNIEFSQFQIASGATSPTILAQASSISQTLTGYENEPLILGGQNNGANLSIVGLSNTDMTAGIVHSNSDAIDLTQWLGIAQPLSVNLTNTTQYGSDFTVSQLNQDGYTTGLISNIEIGDEGIIHARYNNGESQMLGQVVLANFTNPHGLRPVGNSSWSQSYESGEPLQGRASTGRFGSIVGGALEDSNVDLTEELVNLIVAQRNFQANAQSIRTFDQVTQTITNMR